MVLVALSLPAPHGIKYDSLLIVPVGGHAKDAGVEVQGSGTDQ